MKKQHMGSVLKYTAASVTILMIMWWTNKRVSCWWKVAHEGRSPVFLIQLNNSISLAKSADERPIITWINGSRGDSAVTQRAAVLDHDREFEYTQQNTLH